MGLLDKKTSSLQKLKNKNRPQGGGMLTAPAQPVTPGVDPGGMPVAPAQPQGGLMEQKKGGQQQLPPKIQEQLEKFVVKGTRLLHDPKTRPQILQMLQSKEPIEATADATIMIVQRLDNMSRKAGIEIEDTVRALGGSALLDQVVEIGETAGIFKMTPEQKQLALSYGVQQYMNGEIQAGRVDPQKLAGDLTQAVKQMPPEMVQQMDAQLNKAAGAAPQTGGLPSGAAPTAPNDVPLTPQQPIGV